MAGACRVLCALAASVQDTRGADERCARLEELRALVEAAPPALHVGPGAAPALGFVLHTALALGGDAGAQPAVRRAAQQTALAVLRASVRTAERLLAMSAAGREPKPERHAAGGLPDMRISAAAYSSKPQPRSAFVCSVVPGVLAAVLPLLPSSGAAAECACIAISQGCDAIAKEGRARTVAGRVASAARMAASRADAEHMLPVVHAASALCVDDGAALAQLCDAAAVLLVILNSAHLSPALQGAVHSRRLAAADALLVAASTEKSLRGFATDGAAPQTVDVLHGLLLAADAAPDAGLVRALVSVGTHALSRPALRDSVRRVLIRFGPRIVADVLRLDAPCGLWALAAVAESAISAPDALLVADHLVGLVDDGLDESCEDAWLFAAAPIGARHAQTRAYLVVPLLCVAGSLQPHTALAARETLCATFGVESVSMAVAPHCASALDGIAAQLRHPLLYPRAPHALAQLLRHADASLCGDSFRPAAVLGDIVAELAERAAELQAHAGYCVLLLGALGECARVLGGTRGAGEHVRSVLALADRCGRLAVHFVAHDADRVRIAALSCIDGALSVFSVGGVDDQVQRHFVGTGVSALPSESCSPTSSPLQQGGSSEDQMADRDRPETPSDESVNDIDSPLHDGKSCDGGVDGGDSPETPSEEDTLLPLINETWRPLVARVSHDPCGAVAERALGVLVRAARCRGAPAFMRDRVERELLGRPEGCVALLLRPGCRPAAVLRAIVSLVAAVGLRPASMVVRRLAAAVISSVDERAPCGPVDSAAFGDNSVATSQLQILPQSSLGADDLRPVSTLGESSIATHHLPTLPNPSLGADDLLPVSNAEKCSAHGKQQPLAVEAWRASGRPDASECVAMLRALAAVDADQVWFSVAVEHCARTTALSCGDGAVDLRPWKTRALTPAQQRVVDVYLGAEAARSV